MSEQQIKFGPFAESGSAGSSDLLPVHLIACRTFNGSAKRPNEIVISGFDRTGNMVKPWAEAGYTCYCVDLQHEPGERREGNIIYVGADMLEWMPPYAPVKAAFFFPPCTDVSVSGARWFKDKGLGALIMALRLFESSVRLAEWCKAPYLIENPVCVVSSYWRKPDFTFQPWQFGDLYSKRTCLWTGGGFVMPEPIHATEPAGVEPLIWKMAPSPERANKRSETPMGFARAVFQANRAAEFSPINQIEGQMSGGKE